MKSVLQDWVMELGLRHQGVLLACVRGCDTLPKGHPSKVLMRSYRSVLLNAHCGNNREAATFIQEVPPSALAYLMAQFRKDVDHLPHHFVMHMAHAAEVVGYKHPVEAIRDIWRAFYEAVCFGLHVNPETEAQMDERLNADEATFAARDYSCDGPTGAIGAQTS